MSLQVRNTREYINPETFRFKAMIYGPTGMGKTEWVGSCPPEDTGIAACETGVGSGLLTIANRGYDHVIPENLKEFEKFCNGEIFPDKKILVVDSLSAMARTFIKDTALSLPRMRGDSAKRQMGCPELDDYMSIASLTSSLLNRLLRRNEDKHIIVTATEKWDRVNENDPPGTESLFGPNLAGQMFVEAPAMFDFVLRLRVRQVLKNPADAKSKFLQRFFETDRSINVVAKCRSNDGRGRLLLDREEIFDPATGQGAFQYMVDKIVNGYRKEVQDRETKAGQREVILREA